ncbi:hypothetical protein [Actinoplanes sp. NPDC020271]|uniref:hypothetical protein n=1 Tax=Actinoplanes sp. NPDC020271 TaxID=3363896 RepID=UPI003798B99B
MGEPLPEPFFQNDFWRPDPPRPVVPVPAVMSGSLRGRRVLIGVPGLGWRGDLRADEKLVQGSRTYVPVMPEAEWYRAESEKTEVFAALVPIERVWAEEFGVPAFPNSGGSRLVSLDEPPRRPPVPATRESVLTGRRVVRLLDGGEQRDLRATTELYTSSSGDICVRVATEIDWYSWSWSARFPQTMEVVANALWTE